MSDDPRDLLRAAGDEHRAVQASLTGIREHLGPLIVAALRAGVPQHEVHALSGYGSRETVRAIARANGYTEDGRTKKARAARGGTSAVPAPANDQS